MNLEVKFRNVLLLMVVLSIPSTVLLAAQKHRLGDSMKTPEDTAALEHQRRLVDEVAEEFYEKGLMALKAGDMEQAEAFLTEPSY